MKRIFQIAFIAVMGFVSCSEEQEELQDITSNESELNTIVKEYEQSTYFEQTKNNGINVDLDNYTYKEINNTKLFVFDIKNEQPNNHTTKVIALLDTNDNILKSYSLTATQPSNEKYSGNVIFDFYDGQVLTVSFKDGKVLNTKNFAGGMHLNFNGRTVIQDGNGDVIAGDGDIISGGNSDIVNLDDMIDDVVGDTVLSPSCDRYLGHCVGNTIVGMSFVEAAFCYSGFLACLAEYTLDCLIKDCPFGGV